MMRGEPELFSDAISAPPFALCITLDYAHGHIRLEWTDARTNRLAGELRVRCTGRDELTWEWKSPVPASEKSSHHRSAIRGRVNRCQKMFQVAPGAISCGIVSYDPADASAKPDPWQPVVVQEALSVWEWLENGIV